MKRYLNLMCLILLIASKANGQERYADITVKIIEPVEGHTFTSPGTDSVKVHVLNLGPDTVFAGDKYSVQVRFGGGIYFPVYGEIKKTIPPGEYFIHKQILDIDFVPSVEGFPFCVEAKVFNVLGGYHLNMGDEPDESNNKVCISANHIDSRENLGVLTAEHARHLIISPNPTQGPIKVMALSQIKSIQILSLSGQMLMDWKNPEDTKEAELNLFHLDAGVYILEVRTNEGVLPKRILVQ